MTPQLLASAIATHVTTSGLIANALGMSAFLSIGLIRNRRRPESAVVLAAFNLIVYICGTAIEMMEVAAAAGLGLFGVLALARLWSQPFEVHEVGYFAGAYALGLANGFALNGFWLTVWVNASIVSAMTLIAITRGRRHQLAVVRY